jgi:hypothetical protein
MCCIHAFQNGKSTYTTVKLGSLFTLERFFLERYPRECKPIAVIASSPSGYVDFN